MLIQLLYVLNNGTYVHEYEYEDVCICLVDASELEGLH